MLSLNSQTVFNLIQITLEVGLIILGLYIAYFKSYFSEHGKQLALKEHVEDLTDKVEKVKAEIDFISQTRLNLSTNERLSILDFHLKLSNWQNLIMNLNPSDINDSNYNTIDSFLEHTKIAELECRNSKDRLSLLVHAIPMVEKSKAVIKACMELQFNAVKYFKEVRHVYLILEYGKAINEPIEQLEKHKKTLLKVNEISDDFRVKKTDLYKLLTPLAIDLDDYLRKLLFKDVKK